MVCTVALNIVNVTLKDLKCYFPVFDYTCCFPDRHLSLPKCTDDRNFDAEKQVRVNCLLINDQYVPELLVFFFFFFFLQSCEL